MKKTNGCSTGYLDLLWSRAVKIRYGHHCALCGSSDCVEAHHIVHKRHGVLRWDITNGIPLCKKCHDQADTLDGRSQVEKNIGPERFEYLKTKEKFDKKSYLQYTKISNMEFRRAVKKQLKEEGQKNGYVPVV